MIKSNNIKTKILNNGEHRDTVLGSGNIHTPKNNDRQTMIMGSGSNRTAIMDGGEHPVLAVTLSVGHKIAGLKIEKVIAENTGEATLLLAAKDSKLFVVKLYHQNKKPKDELLRLIAQIGSQYVIRTAGDGEFNGRYYELLPYYKIGDLSESSEPLPDNVLESIIVPNVNEGLNAIHSKDVVHRDIKPSNIFWSDDRSSVIIGDFGISSVLNGNISVRATTMSRTLGYSAPETSNGFIAKESDYYSFGITLLHLITGQDPFAGMSDFQILTLTMTKKLSIPANINPRIAVLIKGLTLKEREDRWGYEEVRKWLNNENVPIVETPKPTNIKPYQFNYERYNNLEDLSKAFALNWVNAKKHLFRGKLEDWVRGFGEDLAIACNELKEVADRDFAVFQLIYTLNPKAPLCYKGKFYNDLEHLGHEMYEDIDARADITEMFVNGCFMFYLELDKTNYDPDMINELENFIVHLKNSETDYYYAIMYFLNQSIPYSSGNASFGNILEFASYLDAISEKNKRQLARDVLGDPKFIMWLIAQGFEKQVAAWCKIYERGGMVI
jgi:serine/threonine protein kinase